MSKFCLDCGSELKDGVCPNCSNEKEEKVEKTSSPKKKSKMGLYLLVVIAMAAGIYIGYNYALKEKDDKKENVKTGIVDSWEVTYLYKDDSKSLSKLTFNSDYTVSLFRKNDNTESTTKGLWKEFDNDEYLVILSNNIEDFEDEDSVYHIYMIDPNTICVDAKKDVCKNINQFYRSSSDINKEIREEDLEYDEEEDNDDSYDYDGINEDNFGDYSLAEPDTKGEWTFNMKYKESRDSKKAVVYIFYGDGCPHCDDLFTFLDRLSEDVKDTFVVQKYETWYNSSNEALFKKVSSYLDGDVAEGVPYIVINNQSWAGYNSYYDSGILDAISKGNTRDIVRKIIE